MPDTALELRPLEALRDDVQRDLAAVLEHSSVHVPSAREAAARAATVRDYAAALGELDRQAREPTPLAPPLDVDTLCVDVWHAVQGAGAPTPASDAAVEAIRIHLEGPGQGGERPGGKP